MSKILKFNLKMLQSIPAAWQWNCFSQTPSHFIPGILCVALFGSEHCRLVLWQKNIPRVNIWTTFGQHSNFPPQFTEPHTSRCFSMKEWHCQKHPNNVWPTLLREQRASSSSASQFIFYEVSRPFAIKGVNTQDGGGKYGGDWDGEDSWLERDLTQWPHFSTSTFFFPLLSPPPLCFPFFLSVFFPSLVCAWKRQFHATVPFDVHAEGETPAASSASRVPFLKPSWRWVLLTTRPKLDRPVMSAGEKNFVKDREWTAA